MSLKKDSIIGILLIVLGVYIAITAMQYTIPMTLDFPGPKLYPLIAATGMIICGAGITVGSFQKHEDKKEEKLGWHGVLRILLILAMLVIFVIGLQYFGFIISSLVILTAFTALFGRERKLPFWKSIVFAVIITSAIYIFYVTLFNLKLPTGSITKDILQYFTL
jgi:putative tricarboxylic transport membrane protein